jgi:hypothetical protein
VLRVKKKERKRKDRGYVSTRLVPVLLSSTQKLTISWSYTSFVTFYLYTFSILLHRVSYIPGGIAVIFLVALLCTFNITVKNLKGVG